MHFESKDDSHVICRPIQCSPAIVRLHSTSSWAFRFSLIIYLTAFYCDPILSSYLSVSGLGKGCSGAAAHRAVESPSSPQSSGTAGPLLFTDLCVSSVWVAHIQVSSLYHWAVHFLWFRQHLLYISVNPMFHFVHIHLKLYTFGAGAWSRHHYINALCLGSKLCWYHLYFRRLNFKSIKTSAPIVQFLMFDHQKLSLYATCSTIDLQQSLCIYFLIPVVLTISHKPKPQQN